MQVYQGDRELSTPSRTPVGLSLRLGLHNDLLDTDNQDLVTESSSTPVAYPAPWNEGLLQYEADLATHIAAFREVVRKGES